MAAAYPNRNHYKEIDAIVAKMRDANRPELIHYAGAMHRDDIAARMVEAWGNNPELTELELKKKVLRELPI